MGHLAWVVAAVGLFALALGLRGRRVGDHRTCAGCGYDLTGTPGAARCSECGRDLAEAGATQTGHRERRSTVLAAGAILLLAGGLGLGWQAYAAADLGWQRAKPEWMLRRELASTLPWVRDAAADEFVRRHREEAGSLSAASAEAVLRRAADRGSPLAAAEVNGGEAVLLEHSYRRDDVDPALAVAAMTAGAGVRLSVRPEVRAGDPLLGRLAVKGSGYDRHGGDDLAERATVTRLSLGGLEVEPPPPSRRTAYTYRSIADLQLDLTDAAAGLPPGPHTLRVEGRFDFARRPPPEVGASEWEVDDAIFDAPVASKPFAATTTVKVLPASTPDSAFVVVDAGHAHAMLHAPRLTAPYRDASWPKFWRFGYNTPEMPARALWRLYVRNPETGEEFEWPDGFVGGGANGYSWNGIGGSIGPELTEKWERFLGDAEEVDYHLRPALDEALRGEDPSPIWGGTVVIRGVPVVREATTPWLVPAFDATGPLRGQPDVRGRGDRRARIESSYGSIRRDHPLNRLSDAPGGGWTDARPEPAESGG